MNTQISTALLFDGNGKLLIYLRDDIPSIPFPNHWDLFGGHVEPNELPEEALIRELKEELGIRVETFEHLRDYCCLEGDAFPNTKHVFLVQISELAESLTLNEGQRLEAIDLKDRHQYRFANILASIIDDFVASRE